MVRIRCKPGEPQQYAPVAPRPIIAHARLRLGLMGGFQELAALAPELWAAVARGVVPRLVSIGPAPQVDGQIITFLGENVSAPTRFLVVITDAAPLLMATFAPDAQDTAVLTETAPDASPGGGAG
ncbi:hypothetical protein [Thermogemmatispora onikobensis]|uniref:hypothetical protein n=1 Tax=Thermogemmatispora onikobensis TaxID=732234 RepID=UPI0008531109|nr:hypothetical protein [Thermogemmatispora onikobensis]